jgi:hypothetical protein
MGFSNLRADFSPFGFGVEESSMGGVNNVKTSKKTR